jgi:hypothetical protein
VKNSFSGENAITEELLEPYENVEDDCLLDCCAV